MDRLRDHFPSLLRRTYLNTAGGAPIPDVAKEAAGAYYEESFVDGDVHWTTWLARTDAARDALAGLAGCAPEDVAFVANASAGLNYASLLDEPGGFSFAETEFPSCTLPWLRRGFAPSMWNVAEDGYFDADDVRSSLRADTRVVVLSWVQFTSGFRSDLSALAGVCKEAGVRFVVDATQAMGAFPVDALALGLDVLVFSGYKWMTSGYGIAGLVLPGGQSQGGSPLAGWRSQADPFALLATRLNPSMHGTAAEAGHPPFPGAFAMGASAALWHAQNPERTAETILGLAAELHGLVDTAGFSVLSSRNRSNMSGIVSLRVPDAPATAALLAARGIITSARGEGLRVSMHGYNTRAELEVLVDALVGIREQRPA